MGELPSPLTKSSFPSHSDHSVARLLAGSLSGWLNTKREYPRHNEKQAVYWPKPNQENVFYNLYKSPIISLRDACP